MRTETIFDTYNLVQRLKHVGMEEDQAQEVVHIVAESRQCDVPNLAMESDITILKQDVTILKQDVALLKQDVTILKQDVTILKQDVALLKQDVINIKENMATKADIAEVRTEIHQVKNDILKWMIPFMMTIIALIITQMFKSSFGG